jgi:PhzF family phenazine biosynthesis protein
MRTVRFKQVDVFTAIPFRGNPVAVVLEGEGLDTAQMQHIARWTNLSETTFVLPSASADYRLRIFAPKYELPFAGHPTIGSAHAVLEAGLVKPMAGSFLQECGAGILEMSRDGDTIWVKAPPAKTIPFEERQRAALEQALGCKVLGKPFAVNVGPTWLVADVGDADILARMPVSMEGISRMSRELTITGITVFGKSSDGASAIHVRSFAPAGDIPEDPVCGSGNVSVARYLADSGEVDRYGKQYVARQGMQLGRAGEVSIRIEAGDIYLGGVSVTCVEGTLRTG